MSHPIRMESPLELFKEYQRSELADALVVGPIGRRHRADSKPHFPLLYCRSQRNAVRGGAELRFRPSLLEGFARFEVEVGKGFLCHGLIEVSDAEVGSKVQGLQVPGVEVLMDRLRSLNLEAGPRFPRNLFPVDLAVALSLENVEDGFHVGMLLGGGSGFVGEDAGDLQLMTFEVRA